MEGLRSGKITVEEGRALFEGSYQEMVKTAAPKFGTAIRAIASTSGPAMFHCQGGRDRTGITAALLLRMLGVPRETIAADFVASNAYLDERPGGMSAMLAANGYGGGKTYLEVLALQPRYIEAVFRGIDESFGSFDRYRREGLRVTDEDLTRLRAAFIE